MMNSNSKTGGNEFARALSLDPKNAMALNGMGWANSHLGGADEQARTIDYWRRAVEADPTATSPMRGLAQNAYQNADFDEAVKWYEKWLALDPKNADATAGLEQAKQRQSDVKAANAVATDFFKMLDDGQFADTRSLTSPRTAALFSSGEIHGTTKAFGQLTGEVAKVIAEDWIDFLKKYRVPLGPTVQRNLQSVQYSLNGRSVGTEHEQIRGYEIGGSPVLSSTSRDIPTLKLEFTTKYENKKSVVELLTLDNARAGVWKIRGYVIHETEAPRDPLKD
jgi:tetratricopeptide (TPR) repeat protein